MTDGSEQGSNLVNGGELRSFVERIERLEGEKKELSDDINAVKAEAKAQGYTPKYLGAIIKLRKKSPSEREEDDAMMGLYTAALGMSRDVPLFRHVSGMDVDRAAEDSVLEALKLLVPDDGEITIKVGKGQRKALRRDEKGVFVEDVPDPAPPAPQAPHRTSERPKPDVPKCTQKEAVELGKLARRDDAPIISNPFSWDDKRRAKWDEGWREEDGGDGMGPGK